MGDGLGHCFSQQLFHYAGLCQSRWRMGSLYEHYESGSTTEGAHSRGAPFHRGVDFSSGYYPRAQPSTEWPFI